MGSIERHFAFRAMQEEKKMIFNVIGILIGLAILIAGVYYFIKERADRESRKIYAVVSVIGVLILVGMVIKVFVQL